MSSVGQAVTFCLQRQNLYRTLRIALVVGVLLTLINQGGVLAAGDSTAATWVRCALNFFTPFVVSNTGLLSAADWRSSSPSTPRPGGT